MTSVDYSKYISNVNLARNSPCKSAIKIPICIVIEKEAENMIKDLDRTLSVSLLTTERSY